MQQSWFRESEKHGRTEQAKAKEKEEAKAEEQDNRHLDTRREEAQAQVPGRTGDTPTPTPTPVGKTGEAPQEHGKIELSTTSGTNGNPEKHRIKK